MQLFLHSHTTPKQKNQSDQNSAVFAHLFNFCVRTFGPSRVCSGNALGSNLFVQHLFAGVTFILGPCGVPPPPPPPLQSGTANAEIEGPAQAIKGSLFLSM